jgi:hypothetical protein
MQKFNESWQVQLIETFKAFLTDPERYARHVDELEGLLLDDDDPAGTA